MSFDHDNNLWESYTIDDDEDFIIDDEKDDDWPEYEIPVSDTVLNKEALLEIKYNLSIARNEENILISQLNHNEIDTMHPQGSMKSTHNVMTLDINQHMQKVITAVNTNKMTLLFISCIIVFIWILLKKKYNTEKRRLKQEQKLPIHHHDIV